MFVGFADAAVEPIDFPIAPAAAMPKVRLPTVYLHFKFEGVSKIPKPKSSSQMIAMMVSIPELLIAASIFTLPSSVLQA